MHAEIRRTSHQQLPEPVGKPAEQLCSEESHDSSGRKDLPQFFPWHTDICHQRTVGDERNDRKMPNIRPPADANEMRFPGLAKGVDKSSASGWTLAD